MSGERQYPEGKPLRLDADAESRDPSLPAFLARPADAPVCHGFPLLEETRTPDGWCFGTITDYDCPEGSSAGDAFVVAPDNSRAGLVWCVGEPEFAEIMPPELDRWGVYQVAFERPVFNRNDLVERLQHLLPKLQETYRWASTRHSPRSKPSRLLAWLWP